LRIGLLNSRNGLEAIHDWELGAENPMGSSGEVKGVMEDLAKNRKLRILQEVGHTEKTCLQTQPSSIFKKKTPPKELLNLERCQRGLGLRGKKKLGMIQKKVPSATATLKKGWQSEKSQK